MYAVFKSGGKQYRVSKGQDVRIEQIYRIKGERIEFDKIMMIKNGNEIKMGTPFIKGGKISAEVVGNGKNKKVMIVKFRRRKNYRKHHGHCQWFTEVKITGICVEESYGT